MHKKLITALLTFFIGSCLIYARTIKVSTTDSLQLAINNAIPGDIIILSNGLYRTNASINIEKKGTSEKPIIIRAETTGKAEIGGEKGFNILAGSEYIVIEGFTLTYLTGTSGIQAGASHCRISGNVFECKAPPESKGTRPYFAVSGDDNEISHNIFRNKTDEGQMLSVQGPGGDRMAKRTWIHHNYFYNFPPKANNCSAIQVGLSGRSMDSAFCIVEYNLFIKCAGENEGAICNKACRNIYRFNTFGEGTEELSLRHGNKCEVYGNFFIGSTGLRFSGDDHLIYSNYFERCREAIVCTNGDGEVKEGSKLTCHDRPDRVRVIFNTLVDNTFNFRMPARNEGLGATEIEFSDNIMVGGNPVSIQGIFKNPTWRNNILWNTEAGFIPPAGYKIINPRLSDRNYRIDRFGNIPVTLKPLEPSDVGPEPIN